MAVPATLRPSEIVRIRGDRWRVVHYRPCGAAAILDVVGHDADNRGVAATFLLPFDTAEPLPASTRLRIVRPARWRRAARQALAAVAPAWASLRCAAGARLALLPFQLEPAIAMLQGDACRFLIADAVGLGKSVQAALMIAELLRRWPGGRALIVAPAALREQWRGELTTRFAIDAAVLDAAGVAAVTARVPADVNPWSVPRVTITSIDYVKRPEVIRALESLLWDIVVFDEAHGLAGGSDRAAAAGLLAARARVAVMLTATPHPGDDQAFARLCGIGSARGDDRLVVFRRTRLDTGIAMARRTTLLRVTPAAAERAMHDALMEYARRVWAASGHDGGAGARLAMSVLIRRGCSSAASLRRSLERRILLLEPASRASQLALPLQRAEADEEPQDVLGERGLADEAEERARLDRVLTLAREVAEESKIRLLRRLLARAKQPAIVFTEYRDTLQHLADALADFTTVQLHGGLTRRERDDAIRQFTSGDCSLLLATDAASEGLNLHHRCRLVVNLELPWTPTRLEQRIGRVDRIGQPQRVHEVRLVAANTGEEHVLASFSRRQQRVRTAGAWLERPVADADIAAGLLSSDGRAPERDLSIPPFVAVGARRDEATREAQRLESVRRLSVDPGAVPEPRPVATVLHRCAAPGNTWAYRVLLLDAAGHLLLDTMLGAMAVGGQLEDRDDVRKAVLTRADELGAALAESLAAPIARWTERERHLRERLELDRARLAAPLVQRSLFDRRAERDAAHQQAAIDAAVARIAERLAVLDAARSATAACELVFARATR